MVERATTGLSTRVKTALTACIVLAVVINWLPMIDAKAQTYLTDTISSNAIVFGVVRTLNGVISVVQSSEVSIGVASVGLGEIFDPVNDLIERFSGLLLVTLTALGIQQVILLFTTSLALKIAFSSFAVVLLLVVWRVEQQAPVWVRIGIAVLLLRYLLTLEVGLVWLFDWLYFNATGAEALSVLEATTQVVQNIRESLTSIDLGKLIFGNNDPVLQNEDIGSRISASVVTLIVGMLFKSIIIPVGTLWSGYQISRAVLWGVSQPSR
ncbi:MAG: hypothetical protein R3309_04005 [Reinekea sp.]|nr:hypothetical protein [Reinekea sp.]